MRQGWSLIAVLIAPPINETVLIEHLVWGAIADVIPRDPARKERPRKPALTNMLHKKHTYAFYSNT